jgi:hypothetical protein
MGRSLSGVFSFSKDGKMVKDGNTGTKVSSSIDSNKVGASHARRLIAGGVLKP